MHLERQGITLSRKKIILIVVEGITDRISLENIFNDLIDNRFNVDFHVVHGDIFSNQTINEYNIKSKINDLISSSGKRKFQKSDYERVIHFIDLDGIYLDHKQIIEDRSISKIEYSEHRMFVRNKAHIIQRNDLKIKLINQVLAFKYIHKTIPYNLYFFSGNLEHVLHNKINSSSSEKKRLAYEFDERYDNKINKFVNFMCHSDFSLNRDYSNSWNYIKNVQNKILRATNVDILIKELVETHK